MERTRSCSDESLTFLSWRAFVCATFALATTVVITSCSYATATRPAPASEGVTRLQDSLRTNASVDLGYYSQERGTITGAVSSVSLASSRRPYVRSLAELLQGRVAGLSVESSRSGGISMRVRGGGGEIGAAPLVVVDGDPLPSGAALESILGGIDPNDVVRVDVLKDISSTALYGTRGSNGVVLITLRHGTR